MQIKIIDLKKDSVNNDFAIDSLSLKPVFLKTDTLSVNIKPLPTFSVDPTSSMICTGDSLTLSASGGNIYSWYPSATVAQPRAAVTLVFPSANTNYKVIITDTSCNIRDSVVASVYVQAKPVVTLSKSNDIECTVAESALNATGGVRYHWLPDSTLSNAFIANPIARPFETTSYHVEVTAENGCVAEDSLQVIVTNNTEKNAFLLPDAFTPNNDGLNDRFGVHKWGYVTDLQFAIYDRWGKMLFHTSDAAKNWDGVYSGMPQPVGAYVYFVRANTICGYVEKKGTVVLIR